MQKLGKHETNDAGKTRFIPNIPEVIVLPPHVVKRLAVLAGKMKYDPRRWTSIDLACHGNRIVFKFHADCHVSTEIPLTADLPLFSFSGGMGGRKLLKALKARSGVIVSRVGAIEVFNGDKRVYYRGEFLPGMEMLSIAENELKASNVIELPCPMAATMSRLSHAMGNGKDMNNAGLHGLIWRRHEDGYIDLVATDKSRLAVHNPCYSRVSEQYLLPRELVAQALILSEGGDVNLRIHVDAQGEPLRVEFGVTEFRVWEIRVWQTSGYARQVDLFLSLDTHSPHEIVRLKFADMLAIARIKSKTGLRLYFESNNLAVFDGSNTAIQDAVFYAESVGELNFSIDAAHWRDFVYSLPREYPMAYLMELEIHVRNGVPTRLVWRGNNEARVVLLG